MTVTSEYDPKTRLGERESGRAFDPVYIRYMGRGQGRRLGTDQSLIALAQNSDSPTPGSVLRKHWPIRLSVEQIERELSGHGCSRAEIEEQLEKLRTAGEARRDDYLLWQAIR
jgi:hypothetical protein